MFDAWLDFIELQVRTNPHQVAKMLLGSFLWNVILTIWALHLTATKANK